MTNTRKILWLSHLLPYPPEGGALQRSYHLIRGAAQFGDVDIVTFRQRAFHPDRASVDRAVSKLEEFVNVEGVFDLPADRSRFAKTWLLASSLLTRDPYTVRWNRSHLLNRGIREIAARRRYDLVHFDTIGMFQYRTSFPNAAWVLNHHNVESQMIARRAETAKAAARLYLQREHRRLAEWEVAHGRDATVHIVVSAPEAEHLRHLIPGAEIAVVENPADTTFFAPDETPRQPGHVVFVGRIDAYSNAAAVRWLRDEIWPALRARGLARRLSIVGRNPPGDIVAWGASDPSVEVTGYVGDVRPFMRRAEVYVCPIRDGGGTRLKLLDAMAMGMPIVSHGFAIEGLSITPGCQALVADDAEGIVSAVEEILSNPDRAATLGRNARTHVETHFSVEAVRSHLAAAYERAVGLFEQAAK
jgi:glycosyltransferase involved in cell wall biosynthesis